MATVSDKLKQQAAESGTTITQNTDPAKIQAQKIQENAQKRGIFIPQSQINKISAGISSNKSAGIVDINRVTEANPTGGKITSAGSTDGSSVVAGGSGTGSGTSGGGTGTDGGAYDGIFNSDPYALDSEAASAVNAQLAKKSQFASSLGLDAPASSISELVKQHQDSQAKELSFQEQQNAEITRLQEEQARAEFAKASSAKSATEANFAQGREGVVGSSAFKIISTFKANTDAEIDRTTRRINMAKQQRDYQIEQLKKAQSRGDEKLAESIMGSIASAEADIRQAELDLQNAQNKSMDLAIKMQDQLSEQRKDAFDFFSDMPSGGFADMSAEMISQFMGVDIATASIMKSMDAKRSELDIKDPDYILKQAQISKAINDAKWAGMTNDQKNFEYYKQLKGTDSAAAEEFAKQIGISDSKKVVDYNKEFANNIKIQNDIYNQTGVWTPVNSKYSYTVSPGGISFEGSAPSGSQLDRGECGEFVNDIINGAPGLFGDTFQQKMSLKNSTKPTVGGAFIENTGDTTGHVGMIERVYPDGSFDIRDSNYIGKNTVGTAHIAAGTQRWKAITEQGGFYDPSKKDGGSATPLQTDISNAIKSLKFGSVSAQETAINTVKEILDSGDIEGGKEFLKSTVYNNLSASQQDTIGGKEDTIAALGRIQEKLDDYIAKGGDTGIWTGAKEKALNKVGRTLDPELKELATSISLAIIDYRKAVSGAAFTESEAAEYNRLFPSTGKVPEVNEATINAIKEKIQADTDNFYKRKIGLDKYDKIFGGSETSFEYSLPEDNPENNYADNF